MDITKLSIIELKALKADIYEQNQLAMNNLQIINNELAKRSKEKEEVKRDKNKKTNE